jgi:hypothetical protein
MAADIGSARDQLRQRREELRKRDHIDLVVPSYSGVLGVRYEPIPDEEFDKLVKRITAAGGANAPSNIDAACDLLIKACSCMLLRVGDDLEVLEDESGVAVKFDVRLAEALGFADDYDGTPTARQVVRGVFSPDGTAPLAPGQHANALLEWMQGNEGKIDEALLGE